MCGDQMRRQGAGADHQVHRTIGARQIGGGESRGSGGAAQRQRVPSSTAAGTPVGGVQQHVSAVHRRQRALGVVGKHGDDLDPERASRPPGRHQQQRALAAARRARRDRMVMPQRHLAAAAEHRPQRLDQAREVEQAVDRLGVDNPHARAQPARRSGIGCAGVATARGAAPGWRPARVQGGDAAGPPARLAPPAPAAIPRGGGADQHAQHHRAEQRQVKRQFEHKAERPPAKRHALAIGTGEQRQRRRQQSDAGPEQETQHAAPDPCGIACARCSQ